MDKIEVRVLNPEAVQEAERNMVFAARLTQKGHKISCIEDVVALYNKDYKSTTVENIVSLPHPTVQKFGLINVVVVGASRRFLAQVTRHQNEVKFMSTSLQYSNYSGGADFCIPYEILIRGNEAIAKYKAACQNSMDVYKELIEAGIPHDSAAYAIPTGLRICLFISATLYQWKHMISQRVCKRNTDETQYVFLKIWESLYSLNPAMFSPETTGPFCQQGGCKEGSMCCGFVEEGHLDGWITPDMYLDVEFEAIR